MEIPPNKSSRESSAGRTASAERDEASDGNDSDKDHIELDKEPFLLVCDLDGTLLGDESALEEFFRLWKARRSSEKRSRRRTGRSRLVYATGRSYGNPCLPERASIPTPVVITLNG
eukprot:scaffold128662_cov42-Prasinocladus_malaysianus.AAC.1